LFIQKEISNWDFGITIRRPPPSPDFPHDKMADVTLKRLKQYLGLCFCTGIIRKKSVKDDWSRRNPAQ